MSEQSTEKERLTADEAFGDLAALIRDGFKVGPVGPNSLSILQNGGRIHLTPSETLELASIVQEWHLAQISARLAPIAQALDEVLMGYRGGMLPQAAHERLAEARATIPLELSLPSEGSDG